MSMMLSWMEGGSSEGGLLSQTLKHAAWEKVGLWRADEVDH